MRKLILSTVQTVIRNSVQSKRDRSESVDSIGKEPYKFVIEKTAIRASIEFCLKTHDHTFLFDTIYRFFVDKDLENAFN